MIRTSVEPKPHHLAGYADGGARYRTDRASRTLPQESDESAAKAGKASKQSGADQLEREAGIAERIREKNSELHELVSRQRKTEAQIPERKDKQLNDFIGASGIEEFGADAWRAAESEIKAILARNSSKR